MNIQNTKTSKPGKKLIKLLYTATTVVMLVNFQVNSNVCDKKIEENMITIVYRHIIDLYFSCQQTQYFNNKNYLNYRISEKVGQK